MISEQIMAACHDHGPTTHGASTWTESLIIPTHWQFLYHCLLSLLFNATFEDMNNKHMLIRFLAESKHSTHHHNNWHSNNLIRMNTQATIFLKCYSRLSGSCNSIHILRFSRKCCFFLHCYGVEYDKTCSLLTYTNYKMHDNGLTNMCNT